MLDLPEPDIPPLILAYIKIYKNMIFDNAKFGQMYRTRDGRRALYISLDEVGIKRWHKLILSDTPVLTREKMYADDGVVWCADRTIENCDDIVGVVEIPSDDELVDDAIEDIKRFVSNFDELSDEHKCYLCMIWYSGYKKGSRQWESSKI